MELECEKYHEKMDSKQAACRHAGDYCQFRTSCMIDFIGKENNRSARGASERDRINECLSKNEDFCSRSGK